MALHKDTQTGDVHIPYQWSYADESARVSSSGFVVTDVGKLSRQEDDNTLWILTAITPTWAQIGSSSQNLWYNMKSSSGDTATTPSSTESTLIFSGTTNQINVTIDPASGPAGTATYNVAFQDDVVFVSSYGNKGTTGGCIRKRAEATSGALSGASGTITLSIPEGAKLIGAQLRVDTAVTGAVAWNADYSGGASQNIVTAGNVAKNTKANVFFDTNTDDDRTSGAVTIITITPIGPNFTGGVIRAIVYYEEFTAMADAP
jgi:hypothetical protein